MNNLIGSAHRPLSDITTKEMIDTSLISSRERHVLDITEDVGISTKRVHNIMHEKLQMKKLCA